MSERRRVRIASGGNRYDTAVYDEQGNQMLGVLSANVDFNGSTGDFVTATMEVMVELDLRVDAEVKYTRWSRDKQDWVELDEVYLLSVLRQMYAVTTVENEDGTLTHSWTSRRIHD